MDKDDPFHDLGYAHGRPLRDDRGTPSKILGPERLRVVEETVAAYHASGRPWDQFASRLEPGRRQTVADGLRDLRAAGWIGPVNHGPGGIAFVRLNMSTV